LTGGGQLPAGWRIVKLGEVCDTNIFTVNNNLCGEIDYIDISSIDNKEKVIIQTQTMNISEAPSRARQILKNNDVLVANVRPYLNAVAINNIKSENMVVASTGYSVLRCNNEIDYQYLFFFCQTKEFIDRLSNLAKGSSYPAVTTAEVMSTEILLPPLSEQKRIVDIIQKKYEAIKNLNTLLKTQLAFTTALSPSFLRQAFRGEL
jgi:type I restriction enzyme S subunit